MKFLEPKLPDSPIYDPQSIATISLGEEEFLAGLHDCSQSRTVPHNHVVDDKVLKAANMDTRNRECKFAQETEKVDVVTLETIPKEGAVLVPAVLLEPNTIAEKEAKAEKATTNRNEGRTLRSTSHMRRAGLTERKHNKENRTDVPPCKEQKIVDMHWTKLVLDKAPAAGESKIPHVQLAQRVKGRILHPSTDLKAKNTANNGCRTSRAGLPGSKLRLQRSSESGAKTVRPTSRGRSVSQNKPPAETKLRTARKIAFTPCKPRPSTSPLVQRTAASSRKPHVTASTVSHFDISPSETNLNTNKATSVATTNSEEKETPQSENGKNADAQLLQSDRKTRRSREERRKQSFVLSKNEVSGSLCAQEPVVQVVLDRAPGLAAEVTMANVQSHGGKEENSRPAIAAAKVVSRARSQSQCSRRPSNNTQTTAARKVGKKERQILQNATRKYLSELYVRVLGRCRPQPRSRTTALSRQKSVVVVRKSQQLSVGTISGKKLKRVNVKRVEIKESLLKTKMSIGEFYQMQEKAARVIQRAVRRYIKRPKKC